MPLRLDLRSLAALRVALAAVLLLDLADRSRDLTVHYTDLGVTPRASVVAESGSWRYSLHLAAIDTFGQGVLFCLSGAFAAALLVGYRTRIATIGSWLLLGSLHARNWLLLNSGDELLLMLLFWSMFLPLGARWSLDALRRPQSEFPAKIIASIATHAPGGGHVLPLRPAQVGR